MSRKQAILVGRLHEETERLRAEVNELQAQLCLNAEDEETLEDLWGVWPYTWAQSGRGRVQFFFADRFHCLQGIHHNGPLARFKRKAREAFGGAGHADERAIIA